MSLVAPVVTVDGPAGSGKSTLGRGLARALRLPLVDTGLLYRGVTVAAARRGIAIDDLDGLAEVARGSRLELNTDPDAATPELLVDGADAGADLRDPRHAGLLARVSSLPAVREALLEPQRALARDGAVAVGRDCGTVVFPDAPVKFYLEASEPVRLQPGDPAARDRSAARCGHDDRRGHRPRSR